jgi:MFS transporter, SP family, xylose:H+ symportor
MKENFNIRYVLGISFISALGGYLFGFDFAVITGGLPFLVDQFGLDASGEGGTTASMAIGAVIGCLIAGSIADKYGRKPGLLTAAGIFTISSLIMGISPNLTIFILGRFLAGIGVGMASMLSPLYIAEIAPGKFRGRLVSLNQLTIVLGIVITHLVNYGLKDTGSEAWRWMFGSGAVPATLFFFGVFLLPESPRWLIKENHTEIASKILNKIGGKEFANKSAENISYSLRGEQKVSLKEVFSKTALPIVFIGVVLAVFQQWCGINVVFNYTAKIFESIGADRSEQLIQAVYIGIANLVFTLIALLLVDKLGRKPLMLFGAGGLAVLYLVIALIIKTGAGNILSPFILAAIGTYALSLAPVTWVLISEIFPNRIRGRAISISTVALWMAYSILVFTFPILAKALGEHVPFIAYAIICLLGFLFIKVKLTETKGKSLEEIEKEINANQI